MIESIIKHKEIINLLASIGTFVSAVIAVYTLLEVKKQRLSTYKPLLSLKSFLVYIHKSPLLLEPEELLLFKIENFNEYKTNNTTDDKFEILPLYKIENLGFGLAKNIKVTWKFDMKKAINILEREFNSDFYLSEYEPLMYYFLNRKNDKNFQMSFKNESEILQTTDFIPPINVKEHSHYHSVPKDIVVIHFLYYIFINQLTDKVHKNNYSFDFDNFPKVQMLVEYCDLNDKRYITKYKFKTSIVTTQTQSEIDMSKEFAFLLFEID